MDAKIGTHGTYQIGTDSYPVTVVGVERNGRVVTVQFDTAKHNAGSNYYGIQRHMIYRNEKGRTEKFTWKPSAQCYTLKGRPHGFLHLGEWKAYTDPCF
jgi:hypothetical protein